MKLSPNKLNLIIAGMFLIVPAILHGQAVRVLVDLVNFQDDQRQPWTVEQIGQTMNIVDAFYREATPVLFDFEIRDWRTLPINTTCDLDAIADAAGAETGRVIYTFPYNGCGLTNFTDGQNRVFITSMDASTIAHELGHTFGLSHSAVRLPDGTVSMYGNPFTVMSGGYLKHFNAVEKDVAGWYAVPQITTSGIYRIAPYAAIKIFSFDRFFYFEHRVPYGFDSALSSYGVQNGLLVHEAFASGENYLLDPSPMTGTFSTNGITVTLLSVDSLGADVQVTLPPVCKKFNPKGRCIK